MSYCLNPTCSQPENPDNANFCQACGAMLRLGNRYRAVKLLGQGGFGRTFLAIDEVQDSTQDLSPSPSRCVIKQLLPRGSVAKAERIDRFRQEAERLAALGEHAQIPKLLAHFEETEAQYLVQEYIDGDNLDAVLQQEGPFNEMSIRDLLADLLPVIRFVHSYQVIHRDIKPENIIRPRQGHHFVLVDFGASKYATEAVLARTGTVIGSAGYAAPEQAMGRADFASDLYSLGITCIHLLTGLHPFDLYSVSEDRWVWQQYLPKPISGRLRRVLDKLLEKATSQRYRNATEVLQDLGLESNLPAAIESIDRSSPSARIRSRSRSAMTETWQCVQTLADHEGEVTALAISPGGRILASGSSDNAIRFWSLETGERLHLFAGRSLWSGDGHGEGISTLAFSPDGETLASGSDDGTIKWWDLTTRKLIYTLPSHGWGISAISFHPKGYVLACGSRDGLIQIWDLYHERLITNLTVHSDQISALIFVPKRRILISSSYDKKICLWDVQTQEPIKTLTGHVDRISSIALSQNNRTLVSSSWDKTVKLWDLEFGEQRKVIAAHKRPVTCLALHPTQPLFASGSEDSTIKLWNLESGDRLSTLKSFWGINALAFSPNGQVLVSGGADELIKLWRKRASGNVVN
jgi:WD40 repeat protein